jgi:hypothetical protein
MYIKWKEIHELVFEVFIVTLDDDFYIRSMPD